MSNKNAKRIAKYGLEVCKRAWELNRMQGEGATVIAVETGLHLNSVAAAIEAYAEHRVSMWKDDTMQTDHKITIIHPQLHIVEHPKVEVLHSCFYFGERVCYTQYMEAVETSTGTVLHRSINSYWHDENGKLIRITSVAVEASPSAK